MTDYDGPTFLGVSAGRAVDTLMEFDGHHVRELARELPHCVPEPASNSRRCHDQGGELTRHARELIDVIADHAAIIAPRVDGPASDTATLIAAALRRSGLTVCDHYHALILSAMA